MLSLHGVFCNMELFSGLLNLGKRIESQELKTSIVLPVTTELLSVTAKSP